VTGKADFEFDPNAIKIKNYTQYCSLCGWALALAHAKSGDPALIAGYIGSSDELDKAMLQFALAYAEQNEKDFKALQAAAKKGRIKVAATKE